MGFHYILNPPRTILINLTPQFDFIKLLEPIKDDRFRKNGYLCQQINFEVAVFDDMS